MCRIHLGPGSGGIHHAADGLALSGDATRGGWPAEDPAIATIGTVPSGIADDLKPKWLIVDDSHSSLERVPAIPWPDAVMLQAPDHNPGGDA